MYRIMWINAPPLSKIALTPKILLFQVDDMLGNAHGGVVVGQYFF